VQQLVEHHHRVRLQIRLRGRPLYRDHAPLRIRPPAGIQKDHPRARGPTGSERLDQLPCASEPSQAASTLTAARTSSMNSSTVTSIGSHVRIGPPAFQALVAKSA
jgi:hypothetical protein